MRNGKGKGINFIVVTSRKVYKMWFRRIVMVRPIGYNQKKIEEKTHIYEKLYIAGQVAHYIAEGTPVTGILKELNLKEGYMLVQPSIVAYGNNMRLEKNSPTTISGLKPSSIISRRPLREEDLEQIVEDHKQNTQKDNKK